jgi:hypothetical protein
MTATNVRLIRRIFNGPLVNPITGEHRWIAEFRTLKVMHKRWCETMGDERCPCHPLVDEYHPTRDSFLGLET